MKTLLMLCVLQDDGHCKRLVSFCSSKDIHHFRKHDFDNSKSTYFILNWNGLRKKIIFKELEVQSLSCSLKTDFPCFLFPEHDSHPMTLHITLHSERCIVTQILSVATCLVQKFRVYSQQVRLLLCYAFGKDFVLNTKRWKGYREILMLLSWPWLYSITIIHNKRDPRKMFYPSFSKTPLTIYQKVPKWL